MGYPRFKHQSAQTEILNSAQTYRQTSAHDIQILGILSYVFVWAFIISSTWSWIETHPVWVDAIFIIISMCIIESRYVGTSVHELTFFHGLSIVVTCTKIYLNKFYWNDVGFFGFQRAGNFTSIQTSGLIMPKHGHLKVLPGFWERKAEIDIPTSNVHRLRIQLTLNWTSRRTSIEIRISFFLEWCHNTCTCKSGIAMRISMGTKDSKDLWVIWGNRDEYQMLNNLTWMWRYLTKDPAG